MSAYTHLHVYRCSFCQNVATSPVKVSSLLRCGGCLRLMAYQWSQPIETDEDRAIAAKGVAWNPWAPTNPNPAPLSKRCRLRSCRNYTPSPTQVYSPGIGLFCSPACAEQGVKEFEAFLDRLRNTTDEESVRG